MNRVSERNAAEQVSGVSGASEQTQRAPINRLCREICTDSIFSINIEEGALRCSSMKRAAHPRLVPFLRVSVHPSIENKFSFSAFTSGYCITAPAKMLG